ncbi:helix-turn-helix domain-containing protein [Microbacterium sp. NEAU-LLC]|uniref:Helix-turn-helix domain-containing protein n=1 Tax=Microbacterium helvum TaxID=2773713 RepID=A0ABR8NN58_9MICO|nr:helix-turn-helix domain-containing protein [Microbacterium helvum]MBD3942095.1 helix-turn-helix domain-containing protein [Microbacterium helvum]
MTETEPRAGVQSVHRALDVLEATARAQVLGVTAAAERLQLSTSTVHGLMRTLSDRHYLQRVPGGYRLGPAVATLGALSGAARILTPIVEPVLGTLSLHTGLATTATVLAGREAHLIASAVGPGAVTVRTDREDLRDPLGLATGRVLVAYAPRASWPAFFDAASDVAPRWSVLEWEQEFARIRAASVAVKLTDDPRGAVSLAVPVIGTGGVVVCAIGCYSPATLAADLFDDAALEHLWRASDGLSRALGGPEPRHPQLDFATLLDSLTKAIRR